MEAHHGAMESYDTLKSYSSVKDVHGAWQEPSGVLLADPGATEDHPGAYEGSPWRRGG
jgi:hypothetical protein